MKKSVNPHERLIILGFCRSNTSIVVEMANESLGYCNFDLVKNVEVDIPDFPDQWRGYEFRISTDRGYDFLLDNQKVHFGVLDAHIKYILFHHFKSRYGLETSSYADLVHPTAYFSKTSNHNGGLLVEPLSVISLLCNLGFGVTVKESSSVGHHARIGDFVTINPGVNISGNVQIGVGTTIGSGAVVIHNIKIGKHVIIGAGSVVTRDIPDGVVAFGNPCKVIRQNDHWIRTLQRVHDAT
jgi:sugar O-acyltransferase (sialic acid O-acetyltransferase NeuD family)